MGASKERIRKSMKVERSAQDKGWVLTLEIRAYDNGMIQLDGIPINDVESGYDQVDGWLGATEVAVATINEFRRKVAKEKAKAN